MKKELDKLLCKENHYIKKVDIIEKHKERFLAKDRQLGIRESAKLTRNCKKRCEAIDESDKEFENFKNVFLDCVQKRFAKLNPVLGSYVSYTTGYHSMMTRLNQNLIKRLSDLSKVDDVNIYKDRLFQSRIVDISSVQSVDLNSGSQLLTSNLIKKDRDSKNTLLGLSCTFNKVESIRSKNRLDRQMKSMDIPFTSNHKDNNLECVVQRKLFTNNRRMTIESIENVMNMQDLNSPSDSLFKKQQSSPDETDFYSQPFSLSNIDSCQQEAYPQQGNSNIYGRPDAFPLRDSENIPRMDFSIKMPRAGSKQENNNQTMNLGDSHCIYQVKRPSNDNDVKKSGTLTYPSGSIKEIQTIILPEKNAEATKGTVKRRTEPKHYAMRIDYGSDDDSSHAY